MCGAGDIFSALIRSKYLRALLFRPESRPEPFVERFACAFRFHLEPFGILTAGEDFPELLFPFCLVLLGKSCE